MVPEGDENLITPRMGTTAAGENLAYTSAVLSGMLESIEEGLLVVDVHGLVTNCNSAFAQIWPLPELAFRGGGVAQVWEAIAARLKAPEVFRALVKSPGTAEGPTGLELTDGRRFECDCRLLTSGKVVTGRLWIFRDITARHRDEISLRRLAAIVDSSDDAIVGKDLNGIVTSWNIGAQQIFGYSEQEMIGASILTIIPSERQDEEQEILSRIRRGERLHHFETVRVTKSGRRIHISLTASPIKDSDGRIVGVSKIARDITERIETEHALREAKEAAEAAHAERQQSLESERAARAEAERASRMKDEFLATLSHELRTPLNAILGWTHLLAQPDQEEDDLKIGLDTIERNARAQARIIDDLLDMSRIISGKVRLEVRQIDLSEVLQDAVETVMAAAQGKGVLLEVAPSAANPTVSGDPNRLQQVFWNLLSNAIKFTPRGGRVNVSLERVASHLEVRVVDTGEGIDPEFLPYVFNRFQQADASTTRRHGGLGLGLAIARQLVELHGGTVHVQSKGLGLGAAFTVALPLSALNLARDLHTPNHLAAGLRPRVPRISVNGVRVLVVDDEPDARELIKRLLVGAGAIVTGAGSVAEGMLAMRREVPDLLISDIGMPGEDGFTLIQQVRALSEAEGGSVPAIALTAYARAEDRMAAIHAGFQNHLSKPVEPGEFLAVVRGLTQPRVAVSEGT